MRREDRSSISSQSSRRPRRETGCDVMSSLAPYRCSSFVRTLRAVPSSRPAVEIGAPRAGAVKAGRRAGLASGAVVSRPRLDGPEHSARALSISGVVVFVLAHSNLCSSWGPPRRCGQVCWRARSPGRFGCSRFLAASIQGLSPWRSQVVGFTSTTQAACTNRTRRYRLPCFEILPRIVRSPVDICLGTNPSHAPKSRPFRERRAIADRGHHRARDDRSNARHRHQPLACRVLIGQCFDAGGQDFRCA